MSTKTGLAPTSRTTLLVATQVSGVVITSSPGFTPAIRSAISIVQVPELNARTGRPAEVFGELRLELLHLRAGGNPPGAKHLGDPGDRRVVDRRPGERAGTAGRPLRAWLWRVGALQGSS